MARVAAARILEARDLLMQFGGLKARNGVSITVRADEVLGLIGPNGSGKATLFNVITGIYAPTEGKIIFENGEITGKSPQEIARLGIIRTFQSSRLWLDLSVVDNVLMGMCMR